MRTGAIFARGSCRALKWVALFGVMFALGVGTAVAQPTATVADKVDEGATVPITVGGTVSLDAGFSGEVLTVTATVSAGTPTATVTAGEGNDFGDVGTASITIPENTTAAAVTHTLSGTFNWVVGTDLDAEDEAVSLTFDVTAPSGVTNAADPPAKAVTIEDSHPQLFVWGPVPTLKEAGMAMITLTANPAPTSNGLNYPTTLVVEGATGYTITPTTHDFTDSAPIATITITAPTNDSNRVPDDIMLRALVVGTVTDRVEPLTISVEDLHKLPEVTAELTDEDGDAVPDEGVAEGDVVMLTFKVASAATEAIKITLAPGDGNMARADDYSLSAMEATIASGTMASAALTLTTMSNDDYMDDMLVLTGAVTGADANGTTAGDPVMVMLTIMDGTMLNVTPKTEAEIMKAVMDERALKAGSDGLWTADDEDLGFMADDFFNLPSTGFDVSITPTSSNESVAYTGTDGTNIWVGANENNEPGETTITLTAVVSSTTNTVITRDQNSADSATVTFDITLDAPPAPVLPDLKGQITSMKLTGGVTTKNIGGVTRTHVLEGATDVKLEVTVQWTHAEISALYGSGTTAPPAEIAVQVRGAYTQHQQTMSLPGNWVSWIDEEQDAHFPDAGIYRDGGPTGRVMVKIPAKPKATELPYSEREVRSSTQPITLLILEDDLEAENDAFYVDAVFSADVDLGAGSAVNRTTGLAIIEDNDPQGVTVKKGTSSGPTTVYENADTTFTIAASPARRDLPLDVRLDMLDLSGVTVSAAKISLSTAAVTLNADRSGTPASNSAGVTVHLPASDGDREDDTYDLQPSVNLYSLSAGGYESIAAAAHRINVLDIHKLPPLMVSPAAGSVKEGGELELTLTINRNPPVTIATGPETRQYTHEALTIGVMAGGTASASDYTMTPAVVTVGEHNKKAPWTQDVMVTIAASSDEDIDIETLVLDFVANGTVAANGLRPDDAPAYDAQASLTIEDETAALVSVRDNAYDVIKGVLGDPPMLSPGMSAELMGVNLFDYDSNAVSVTYGTSVEGGAATASSTGGTVTVMGVSAGEAKVTITATATPNASSLIVNQTKANVAQMTFPVMVTEEALTFMVTPPEDMNLVEGGMGGMVTVMTNRPVAENTEVMLMRDGSSSASEADYMLDPPLVTIMAGQMSSMTMVTAKEDDMVEEMEMLTLFIVVDGMQMPDQSVSLSLVSG